MITIINKKYNNNYGSTAPSLPQLRRLGAKGFEGLPNLSFSEEWFKRVYIPKKTATENRIGFKKLVQSLLKSKASGNCSSKKYYECLRAFYLSILNFETI